MCAYSVNGFRHPRCQVFKVSLPVACFAEPSVCREVKERLRYILQYCKGLKSYKIKMLSFFEFIAPHIYCVF
jgi:hypothetical protein